MYTTIIFDLSEVLIPGLVGVEDKLAAVPGIDKESVLAQFFSPPILDFFHGEMSEQVFLDGLIERSGWNVTADELKTIIRENFSGRIPGMENLLHELGPRYGLVLLSDHGKE